MYAIPAEAQPRLRWRILNCSIDVPAGLPQLKSLHSRAKKLLDLFADAVGRCSWPVGSACAACRHASEQLALDVEDLDMDCMYKDCTSLAV